jgi:phenylalanyl-tRNA synthetase beta chain
VSAGTLCEAIRELRLPLLSCVQLIDCFEPEGQNVRNLTFRLTFRHAERTLKDAEADKQRDIIATALQQSLAVRI